ncbi:hypothetical protein DH09_12750 [Bacillaceae bacterium JMAK1]|nr:hypothetical protein DH09_12750 [Bacillaceae bacterium JMAK1]
MRSIVISLFVIFMVACSNGAVSEAQQQVDETSYNVNIPEHTSYEILSIWEDESMSLDSLIVNYGHRESSEPNLEIAELADFEYVYGGYDGETKINLEIHVSPTTPAQSEEVTIGGHPVEATQFGEGNENVSHHFPHGDYFYSIYYLGDEVMVEDAEAFTQQILEEDIE